ncbi:MAG: GNAT family N-acetyltransferase [Qingshengfaniella sp.]
MIFEQVLDQPSIATERLWLRPLRRSDEGLLTLYSGDERVARNTRSIPHPLPPGTSAAFIARALASDRKSDVWVMDGASVGLAELLGLLTLTSIAPGRSEITYWVAPAFWNTGFASEAVRGLLKANPQSASTVFAEVFQTNAISARVLTNLDFNYIGDAEAYSVAQGRTVPTWTYLRKLD